MLRETLSNRWVTGGLLGGAVVISLLHQPDEGRYQLQHPFPAGDISGAQWPLALDVMPYLEENTLTSGYVDKAREAGWTDRAGSVGAVVLNLPERISGSGESTQSFASKEAVTSAVETLKKSGTIACPVEDYRITFSGEEADEDATICLQTSEARVAEKDGVAAAVVPLTLTDDYKESKPFANLDTTMRELAPDRCAQVMEPMRQYAASLLDATGQYPKNQTAWVEVIVNAGPANPCDTWPPKLDAATTPSPSLTPFDPQQ